MRNPDSLVVRSPFALLLEGEPLTRKTSLAFQFPNVYFLDADMKLSNAARIYPTKRDFKFDFVDVDDRDLPVPPAMRWTRMISLLKTACSDPSIDTIVVDSLTRVNEYLNDYIIAQPTGGQKLMCAGMQLMTQQMWWPFKQLYASLISTLKTSNKHIIVISHTKIEKDINTGSLFINLSVPGQTGEILPSLFTDVWQTSVKIGPPTATNPSGVNYWVRTMPTPYTSALCSSLAGLPHEFQFTWDFFKPFYDQLAKPVPPGPVSIPVTKATV